MLDTGLTKEDFSQKGAIFLQPKAQFDYFIEKADDPNLPQIIIAAMESIEDDYANLKGVLPKQEYQSILPDLLGDLVRTLNPEELLGWELPQSVSVNQRVVFLLLDTQSLHFVLQGCTLQAQPLSCATTPEI
jgi:type I restriction-modification system DNA methylase subunit